MKRIRLVSAIVLSGALSWTALPAAAQSAGEAAAAGTDANPVVIPVVGVDDRKRDDLISVHLEDVELVDVVKLFTRIAPLNVAATPTNLQGTVTVHLQNVPWKPALDAILAQRGFMLSDPMNTGMYSIVEKPKDAQEPLFVKTHFVQYADLPALAQVIQKIALDPRGKVAEYLPKNALVLRTVHQNLSEVATVIADLDTPRKQVFIEARFVEIRDSSGRKVGLDWENVLSAYEIGYQAQVLNQQETITRGNTRSANLGRTDGRTRADAFAGTYNQVGKSVFPAAGGSTAEGTTTTEGGGAGASAASATLPTRTIADALNQGLNAGETLTETAGRTLESARTAVLSPFAFNLVISALKSREGTTILSNPKIIVANGERALIHIGEERRPFDAQVTPATQTTAPFTTYKPGEAVQFGVKIGVKPTINTDTNITVLIEPELSRLVEMDTAPDGKTSYPVKSTKKIQTLFTLESGKTAAIGGLTETQDGKTTKRIPLLGDIPLLGRYLFSHEADTRIQQETIIFVTVGLVAPEGTGGTVGLPENAEMVRKHALRRQMEARGFQEELDQMRENVQQQEEKADKRKKLLQAHKVR